VASITFPFRAGYPVVELVFLAPDGRRASRRLVVDTGFTGVSAFVLPAADASLADRSGPAGHVSGALTGVQDRSWLIASVPALRFRSSLLCICTDVSTLALPPGATGLAGLTFLQRFHHWGATRDASSAWSFELTFAGGG
jgi:hypothetical protein